MGVRLQSIEKTVWLAGGFILFACGAVALTRIHLPEQDEPGTPPPDPAASASVAPGTENPDTVAPAETTPAAPEDTSTPVALGQLCGIAGPNHWICVLPNAETVDVSLYEARNGELVLYYDDLDPETPGVPMASVPEGATEVTHFIGAGCDLTIQGIGGQSPAASISCP